jgi:CRISPR-associated endonuclease/helicase Cas3
MLDVGYSLRPSLPDRPREEWEPLGRHLAGVAELAGKFAAAFGGEDLARALGLLHDVDKASDRFQRYLRGTTGSVDHSTAGAKLACARYGQQVGKLLAFCVARHHAGLADGAGAEGSTLAAQLTKKIEDYRRWEELALDLPSNLGASASFRVREDRQGFQVACMTPMLDKFGLDGALVNEGCRIRP